MTATACLRVDVSAAQSQLSMSELGPLVQKFTIAYLEMRWAWPRRYAPLSEVSFLLTDAHVEVLDVSELKRLSGDLQTHLFGTAEEGDVTLLLYEGNEEAVTVFAAMDAMAVAEAAADRSRLPPGGRLTRISGRGEDREIERVPARDDTAERPNHWMFDHPPPPPPAWEGVQGIYFTPREIFYGDIVTYMPRGARTHLSLVDGAEHLPADAPHFDAECLGIVVRYLGQRRKGALLYLPISFTSLVRPSLRAGYGRLLDELPVGRRGELGAAIYDVPRDPAFEMLQQVKAMLHPRVSSIDLRTSDPEFEVEKLPPQAVTSVTFILPDADAMVRLSSLRRFAERISRYKQRRIWPAVSNIRRRAELEAAIRLRIPFLTGPAVCGPLTKPIGGHAVAAGELPLVDAAASRLQRRA